MHIKRKQNETFVSRFETYGFVILSRHMQFMVYSDEKEHHNCVRDEKKQLKIENNKIIKYIKRQ